MNKKKLIVIAVAVSPILLLTFMWVLRWPLSRIFPITHTGTVMRIATFNKGYWGNDPRDRRMPQGTNLSMQRAQPNQFAIVFEDGFNCEGYDTSFAAVREGDTIEMRGYHDVRSFPVLNPEWWECDEGQLVRIVTAKGQQLPAK